MIKLEKQTGFLYTYPIMNCDVCFVAHLLQLLAV